MLITTLLKYLINVVAKSLIKFYNTVKESDNMNNNISEKELKRLKEIERKQKERYKTQNEYANNRYDRLSFTVPKGKKIKIETVAKNLGMTVNKFISEVILKIVVNNDILEMIFNNNINNIQNGTVESVQNTNIEQENSIVEESVMKEKPVRKEAEGLTEKEKWMELQKQYEQRHEESKEWKRQQEERKEQTEKERQEEFKNLVNGVFEGMRAEKERMREEDRKKYKQLDDEKIDLLLNDPEFSAWLENTGFENALEPLIKEMGIINAERVIKTAKERKRKESIEKSGCPF